MPRKILYKKIRIGDASKIYVNDVLWSMLLDGTGAPAHIDDAAKMEPKLIKDSPRTIIQIHAGQMKLEKMRRLTQTEKTAFEFGTARLELDGTISVNDPELVEEDE